jgi:uncharacterized protein RhaS with RHS repeats
LKIDPTVALAASAVEATPYTGGDLTSIADPLGRTTTRYYDVVGRPLSVIGPSGEATLTRWDGDDQVTPA